MEGERLIYCEKNIIKELIKTILMIFIFIFIFIDGVVFAADTAYIDRDLAYPETRHCYVQVYNQTTGKYTAGVYDGSGTSDAKNVTTSAKTGDVITVLYHGYYNGCTYKKVVNGTATTGKYNTSKSEDMTLTVAGTGKYVFYTTTGGSNFTVSVTLNVSQSDTTPPTASDLTLSTTYTNTGTLRATAHGVSDNSSGVNSVKWYVRKSDWSTGILDQASTGQWYYDVDVTSLGEGTYIVGMILYDNAGNLNDTTQKSSTSYIGWKTFYYDKTAPTYSNFLPTGTTYTNDSNYSVAVSVSGADNLSGVKTVSLNAFYGDAYNSNHSSKTATYNSSTGKYEATYSLSEIKNTSTGATNNGEGKYNFDGHITDNANNGAWLGSGCVVLDKTKPTMVSLTANTTSWTNGNVTLTGKARDTRSGIIAYAFTTSSTTPTSWTSITASTSELSHTYSVTANNTYYYWVKDQAGNVNSTSINIANIDKVKPTISSYTISKTATNQNTVSVTLVPNDASSGINRVEFKAYTGSGSYRTTKTGTNSNGTYTATFRITDIVNASTNTPPGTEGTYYIEAYVYDNAGNEAYKSPLSVLYDTLAPYNPSIVINNDAKYTNSRTVTLRLSAEDAGSGVAQVALSNSETIGTYETYTTTKTWTLTANSGVKTVYAIYKDAAGNTSASF